MSKIKFVIAVFDSMGDTGGSNILLLVNGNGFFFFYKNEKYEVNVKKVRSTHQYFMPYL